SSSTRLPKILPFATSSTSARKWLRRRKRQRERQQRERRQRRVQREHRLNLKLRRRARATLNLQQGRSPRRRSKPWRKQARPEIRVALSLLWASAIPVSSMYGLRITRDSWLSTASPSRRVLWC